MYGKKRQKIKQSYIFEILLGFFFFSREQFNRLIVGVFNHDICAEPKIDNAGINIQLRLGVNSISKVVSGHDRLALLLLGFQMLHKCQRLLNLRNLLLISQA